jgi:hypothetical protein
MARALFDRYVFVDWSARSQPGRGKDSIWFAAGTAVETSPPRNPATRDEATRQLRTLLVDAAGRRERVLLGFDFPYGYPAGFAAALKLPASNAPWRATWSRLCECTHDGTSNANRRFHDAAELNRVIGSPPGPFWGHPQNFSDAALTWRVGFPFHVTDGQQLRELRHTERHLRKVKRTAFPVWKLAGQGAVGSQALLGIPRVAGLREDPGLAPFSLVWPFETGFDVGCFRDIAPFIVHAEIWPGVLDPDPHWHPIVDARQVLALVDWARRLDERGELADEFHAPATLTPSQVDECLREEGWILGATTARLRSSDAGPSPGSQARAARG